MGSAEDEGSFHPPPSFDHAKMSCTNFPRLDGEDPEWWKDYCVKYFHMFCLPPDNWASFATLHFQGIAKSSLHNHESLHIITTWSNLVIVVFAKFDVNKYGKQLEQLFKLTQIGTLAKYRAKF